MHYLSGKLLKMSLMACAAIGILSSCQKSNDTYDTYFYLSKSVGESTAHIKIDGQDKGSITTVSYPVTTATSGLNHLTLPSGRHNVSILDQNNVEIISCYLQFSDNSIGTGSWGNGGGGDSCSSVGNDMHKMIVGLWK